MQKVGLDYLYNLNFHSQNVILTYTNQSLIVFSPTLKILENSGVSLVCYFFFNYCNPHLIIELLTADGWWKGETQFSLRMWLLVGQLCTTEWHHIHGYMNSIKWAQELLKGGKYNVGRGLRYIWEESGTGKEGKYDLNILYTFIKNLKKLIKYYVVKCEKER